MSGSAQTAIDIWRRLAGHGFSAGEIVFCDACRRGLHRFGVGYVYMKV
jgi:hypothetical protein